MTDWAAYILRAPNVRTPTLPLATRDSAGGKGQGLLRLPLQWYPETLIISPDAWVATKQTVCAEDLAMVSGLAAELNALSRSSTTQTLLLRSSAKGESIADRGTYLSLEIPPTVAGLAEGIQRIWDHAAGRDVPVGLLIQPLITALRAGHLSNEDRISRASTTWLFEVDDEPAISWQVQKVDSAEDGELPAHTTAKLDYQLHAVARRLSDNLNRMHLEWVWDGSRTWIVQADPVPPTLGPAPGDRFHVVPGAKVDHAALKVWQRLDDSPSEEQLAWPKVRAIYEFRAANLGGPEFWILNGSEITPGSEESILADLELLCSGHILMRTDVQGSELSPNLKRSDALIHPTDALAHLKMVTGSHTAAGGNPSDLCFIAHRFTRARASAWAAAWPSQAEARIDSLWGLADGLQYLPHDTAWVNTDTGHVQRNINAKTRFLETHDGSDWHYEATPTEWIWKASASRDQLKTIATCTQRIANARSEPVVILWFVGVLDGYNAECLAWVTTPGPHAIPVGLGNHARCSRYQVETAEDVAQFSPGAEPVVLHLKPSKELLRDNSFLESVANAAKKFGVAVEMAGSPLAHAYYQLDKAGVTVLCLDSPEPPVRDFNKLVRDGIVPLIEEHGERVVSYRATPQEHRVLLKRKLVEEAIEVLDAAGDGALLEELADVEEVLAALRRSLGVDRDAVLEIQKAKRDKRGGFDDATVLVETGGRLESEQSGLFESEGLRRSRDVRQVEMSDGNLTFSLIPPPPEQRAPFVLTVGNYQLRGRYDTHQLTLDVGPAGKDQSSPEQLEGLFPDPSE